VRRSIALIHRTGTLAPAASRFVALAGEGRGYPAEVGNEEARPETGGAP
jgi:hypothetical protein